MFDQKTERSPVTEQVLLTDKFCKVLRTNAFRDGSRSGRGSGLLNGFMLIEEVHGELLNHHSFGAPIADL